MQPPSAELPDPPLGLLLNDLARLLRKEFDHRLRHAGVSLTRAQWMILFHVARAEGASQTQIADALELERMTVGRHVTRLADAGWLERRTDGGDARIYRLHLREKARRTLTRLEPVLEQLRRDYLAGIPRDRRQALFDDLHRIRENVNGMHFPDGKTKVS